MCLSMKMFLRVLAAVILLGAGGWWVGAGRNLGWTKNRVAVEKRDEITEIMYMDYEERFVPGVDFLAGAGGFALLLGGISLVGRGKHAAQVTSR